MKLTSKSRPHGAASQNVISTLGRGYMAGLQGGLVFCAIMLSTGCASTPVYTAVDTLCASTTRYHATDTQIAIMKADQLVWQPLVDWLASFNRVRDDACLKPVSGP